MVDGVALLTTLFHGMHAEGLWSDVPGTNVLDLGAPFYNVYETADSKYVTIAAGEPQFYAELVQRLGLDDELLRNQSDPSTWDDAKQQLAAVFKTKTRDEWCEILEDTETCFAPVLGLTEAPTHPHNVKRGTFVEIDGIVQPRAAPRFSRTAPADPGPLHRAGQHTIDVLLDAGIGRPEVDALLDARIVRQARGARDPVE